MKYLAILVLLFAPAMAQEKKDPYNLDALYDNKPHGGCYEMQTFADRYGTGNKLYEFMAKIPKDVLEVYIDEALVCADIGTGTKSQLATAVWVLHVASDFRTKMLIDKVVTSDEAVLQDLASRNSATVESCNKLRTDFLEHLDRDRTMIVAQPSPASRMDTEAFYIPPPQHPVHCVASSSPLGTSSITSVNCY